MSLARFLSRTSAEGPGQRTALWMQGCSIRCPGCFNPHMWSTRGGDQVGTDELAARVLATDSDGLTLLGGEPFEQAEALADVAAQVRQAGRSVMTFTGYTRAELADAVHSGRPGFAALLDQTDLLAAGPFLADQLDRTRPWVGSTNQELVLLGDRFPRLLDQLAQTPDRIEVTVDGAGRISVNGWASPDALDALLSGDLGLRTTP